MTVNAFCPNCGKRYLNMRADFLDNDPGCGDCAQAGVRPRTLYRLLLLTAYEDTVDPQPACGHSMTGFGGVLFVCSLPHGHQGTHYDDAGGTSWTYTVPAPTHLDINGRLIEGSAAIPGSAWESEGVDLARALEQREAFHVDRHRILMRRIEEVENALRVAWPIVKSHGDEHEIVTVKDALAAWDAANSEPAAALKEDQQQ